MDFIAIDFETANKKFYSACSLGLIIVKNNQITEEKYWLIKPPEMHFDSFNVSLHGITEKDVYDKSGFNILWNEIKDYFNDKIVFAHNASFDIYVLRDLLDYYDLQHPNLKYACTMKLSQKAWNLENYKLKTIANYLDCNFQHHNALEDARVCAEIVLKIYSEINCNSIDELFKKLKLRKKIFPEKGNQFKTFGNNQNYEYKVTTKNDKNNQNAGCLLILFIVIPIIIIIIFFVMCSRI